MYICICNALRQSQIEEMAKTGIRCEKEAYARLGCKPKCGVCLPVARALVQSGAAQSA